MLQVLTSSLSIEQVSYTEDSNFWIGPRQVCIPLKKVVVVIGYLMSVLYLQFDTVCYAPVATD
jgi:hypothetical protein